MNALCEKVCIDDKTVSISVLATCGMGEHGQQDILAINPMLEESEDAYILLFRSLKERGLRTPQLVISDAHSPP